MSILKINHVKDLSGIGGFQLEAANITTNGTLRVTDLAINGVINGTASSIIPALPGSNYYLTTNGSSLSWQEVSSSGGFKSMQVWTGNGTWSKPQGIRSILVRVVGAGGGGSGYTEAGGAGGHGEVIVDVNNVNSVGVTVGSPVVAHIIMVVVVMVMHHHLVDMYLLMVVQVLIVITNTLVDLVDMDLVVTSTHMVEVAQVTDLTILMVI